MKRLVYLAVTIVLLIGLLPAAAAAQTGTQLLLQAPDPTGLGISDQAKCSEPDAPCHIADNFSVPAGGMTIGQIELWGTYVDGNYNCIDAATYVDSFGVFFGYDAGGVPEIAEGWPSLSPDSRTLTGGTVMGCPEYKFVLKIPALGISLEQGTRWIEIYNSGGDNTAPGKYFAWEKGVQDINGPSLGGTASWNGSSSVWSTGFGDWMALGLFAAQPIMGVSNVSVNVKTGRSGSTATGQVVISDYQGQPVSKALVSVRWTMPDGSTLTQQATTGRNGTATFRGAKDGPGQNYTLCVSGVTKAGWDYIPNQFTCPPP